jgi:4-amino-4-deoxy-L-arabinose transferase-like glycosyltransferase
VDAGTGTSRSRAVAWLPAARRDRLLLLAAIVLAVAVRLVYVLATHGHALAGDEVEYDVEGRFAAHGHLLWSTTPYGDAHPSTWKAPGYAVLVGAVYAVVGHHPDAVLVVQALVLAPLSVLATWFLGRRLFGETAASVAAVLVAVYPNAWQYDARLYSEVLSVPLTTALLAVVLGAAARRRGLGRGDVLLLGVVLGAALLIRPSAVTLVPAIAIGCWWALGARRGTAAVLVVGVVAVALVVPWSVRNARLAGPWVPLSVQSAAAYGVFNDDAAHDAKHRWAWRPLPSRDRDLLVGTPRTDGEVYQELNRRAADYVRDHPASVVEAFWANGVRRLYELRSPDQVLNEVHFEGRTRAVAAVGLALYYPIALLALLSLVIAWRDGRRGLVLAVASLLLASAVAFTTDSGTRYRVPLEPLLVVLAVGAVSSLVARRQAPPSD